MRQINAAAANHTTDFNPRDDGASRFNEMTSEDFIRVIFTELQNQDPLDPSDTTAVLDQLNSIRSIESDIQLTAKLESLVTENQLSSASSMIGKFIGGLTEDANRVAGQAVSVVRQDNDIFVELDNGWFVPIDNVETIVDPSQIEEVPGDSGGGTPQPDDSGDGGSDGGSDGADGGDDAGGDGSGDGAGGDDDSGDDTP